MGSNNTALLCTRAACYITSRTVHVKQRKAFYIYHVAMYTGENILLKLGLKICPSSYGMPVNFFIIWILRYKRVLELFCRFIHTCPSLHKICLFICLYTYQLINSSVDRYFFLSILFTFTYISVYLSVYPYQFTCCSACLYLHTHTHTHSD